MKHTIALLTFLLSVLTAPATLVRFNMADITGRTNDLPITVQGLVMPFGSSNYVVVGYPQRLQPVGGTITTNLVPGSYRLSVIGPSPAQTLDFSVTNSASVLDVRDLGSYKLSSFTASQYYTAEQSEDRFLSIADKVTNYASDFYASPRPVFIREPVRPLNASGGRTLPPMGYAPWNTFACNVSQNGLSNQMRWMINRGLREAGYTNSVSIDDGWQTNRTAEGLPMIDGTRYPLGFPWLTDWARTNGFRMTVWTPADFYNYYTNGAIAIGSCGSGFRQGSGGYEFIDLPWYVTNGFSGAKLDYFGYAGDLVATMSNFWAAAQATGVDFPIDAVGYAAPFYPALIDYCSTLRVARDIRPTWAYVQYQIDEMDKNAKYQRPGFWPHPDMMVVGVTNGYGSLSTHEAVSHFGLWCIMGAPLIIGADCSTLSAALNTLLTNAAYISIDQDPLCAQGRRIKSELVPTGDLQVWVKPLGSYNSGTNAVLLMNNSSAAAYVYVYFDEIGLGTNCTVLDLTTPANRGQQTEFYREYLASHQSVLLKVTGTPRQGVTLTATPRAILYNTMSNVFLAGTFRGDGSALTGVVSTASTITTNSLWLGDVDTPGEIWLADGYGGNVTIALQTNSVVQFGAGKLYADAVVAGAFETSGSYFGDGSGLTNVVSTASTAASVAMAARGVTAQSTNLFEAQDSASNVVASVSAAGVFTGNGSGLTNLLFPGVVTNLTAFGIMTLSNGTAGAALYTENGVIKTTNDFESVGTISAANQRWTISSAELNCGFDLAVWNAEDGGMYFSYENLAIGASNTAPWYFSAGGDIKAASVISGSFTGNGSGLTNLAADTISANANAEGLILLSTNADLSWKGFQGDNSYDTNVAPTSVQIIAGSSGAANQRGGHVFLQGGESFTDESGSALFELWGADPNTGQGGSVSIGCGVGSVTNGYFQVDIADTTAILNRSLRNVSGAELLNWEGASLSGNGFGLTNLPMTSLVGTQLNFGEGATITRGPGEVMEFSTEIVGIHVGAGDGLTNLNANALASGTVPETRIPTRWGGITNAQTDSTGTNVVVGNSRLLIAFGSAKTLTATNGRVGLGTLTPAARLDVSGASLAQPSDATVTAGDLTVDTESKVVTVGRLSAAAGENSVFQVRDRLGNLKLRLPGSSTESIYLSVDNTFVGIGTTNPATKLDVQGQITTRSNLFVKDRAWVTNTLTASNFVATVTGGTNRAVNWTSQTNAYEDIIFSIALLNPPGSVNPGTLVWTNGPSTDQMAIVFGNGEQFHVTPQLGHTWVAGTTIFPHVHCEPQTANSITNTWEIYYSIADIGGTFPVSTAVTNTVIIPASSQYKHTLVSLPTNGISMATFNGPSTKLKMRYVLRTTSEPLHVLDFDIHYRTGGSPVPYNAP